MKTLIFLLLTFYSRTITTEKYMKLYNLVCEHSSKWIDNNTCNLKVIGRNLVVANMEMDLKRTLKNISVHIDISKFYSGFRPYLVNITFNACDVLNKKAASGFYINLFLRILSKYSNAVQCPLSVSKVH